MKPILQITKDIDGIATELVIQRFGDRVLVLVTQLGKVGNLIQATIPATTPLIPSDTPFPQPPPSIQLTPLLGGALSDHNHTLHSLYVAQIATIVWMSAMDVRKPVVVGLALRKSADESGGGLTEQERAVFEQVMALLQGLLST